MAEPKEPQSYGSEGSWVSGDVGQEVNRQKGRPNSQHADFYSSHRESEENAPDQGGRVSPVQAAENADAPAASDDVPSTPRKVTARKRGFFKKRDY